MVEKEIARFLGLPEGHDTRDLVTAGDARDFSGVARYAHPCEGLERAGGPADVTALPDPDHPLSKAMSDAIERPWSGAAWLRRETITMPLCSRSRRSARGIGWKGPVSSRGSDG